MSHYSSVTTNIKDKNCLLAALEEMGFSQSKLKISDEPINLEGYQGDKREQKAEIILPRSIVGGVSNDIGFAKQADGTWGAIISDYDKTNGTSCKNKTTENTSGYNDHWLNLLSQRYAKAVLTQEIEDKTDMSIEDIYEEDGEIFMEIEVFT